MVIKAKEKIKQRRGTESICAGLGFRKLQSELSLNKAE
jgi:hypothetical protein